MQSHLWLYNISAFCRMINHAAAPSEESLNVVLRSTSQRPLSAESSTNCKLTTFDLSVPASVDRTVQNYDLSQYRMHRASRLVPI